MDNFGKNRRAGGAVYELLTVDTSGDDEEVGKQQDQQPALALVAKVKGKRRKHKSRRVQNVELGAVSAEGEGEASSLGLVGGLVIGSSRDVVSFQDLILPRPDGILADLALEPRINVDLGDASKESPFQDFAQEFPVESGIPLLSWERGVLMSMDLLRQMAERNTDPPRSRSSARLRFIYQMEEYEGCGDCAYYHYSGSYKGACCRKIHSRKWGPLSPPPFQFFEGNFDFKLRMTPAAERNHPFLRRTPGIDYSQRSNSTNYVYLFPDPIPAPIQAPEPSFALPPLFWDDYQQPYYAPWENKPPEITVNPPLMDYSYEDVEPPIA